MRQYSIGSGVVERGSTMRKLVLTAIIALALCWPSSKTQAESLWTPSVDISGTHDDNIELSSTNEVDDYIYMIKPGIKFDYNQEVTQITSEGRVVIRRYQDNDDLDDETYRFDLEGDSKITERLKLEGSYQFIKDTTLDSELEETGRIFLRDDRFSHSAKLATNFNLSERTTIGLSGRYRDVTYDSDSYDDYTSWSVSVPVRWLLATQVDTVSFSPGYAYRDSDASRSTSYNCKIGWDHLTTERLTFRLSAGVRYTEHEDPDTGETDETWGGLGDLKLKYDFQTGNVTLDLERSLRNTAEGYQADVSKVALGLRWHFSERTGMELKGEYFYTTTEGETNDDTTQYFQVGPNLFYKLTENHKIFIAYDYSHETQDDADDSSDVDRQRVWAGISLNFPML